MVSVIPRERGEVALYFSPMSTVRPQSHAMKPLGVCVVRSAVGGDAARVLECARDVFATSRHTLTQADEFAVTEGQEREFLEGLVEHARAAFVVGVERDEPGATVIGIASLKQANLKRKLRHVVELGMGVRSTHRGRGVGTALLATLIDWAVAHPEIEIVTLGVYAENAAGITLYKSFGFEIYGRLPGGCKHDDGSRWEQLMMYRRVT